MSGQTEVLTEQAVRQRLVEDSDPFRYGWRYVWQKDASGLMRQVQVPLAYEDVLHPQEEDFFVTNGAHGRDCSYLEYALQLAMKGRNNVEVLREVRVDWGVEGVKAHGPDLSVFIDLQKAWKRHTGTFMVKETGARPVLVIEVTSPRTRSHDLDDKVVEYHKAGVPFYAIVDYRPEMEDRQVHIIGYRASPEGYIRVALNEHGRLWLEPVKLWLAGDGDRAVCFDEQGAPVADILEIEQAACDAKTEAVEAKREAQEAQRKITEMTVRMVEMEAELKRLRGNP